MEHDQVDAWVAAAVIAGKVLDLLSAPLDEAAPIAIPAGPTRLSKAAVAAQFLGIEPHVIDAWVRSGALRHPPWSEEELRSMEGLRGSLCG